MIVRGRGAIDEARKRGLTLTKDADPTEGARDDVSPDEAAEIAREDASLLWVRL